MSFQLTRGLGKKIDDYRAARRAETGKVMMRTTAINELLLKALDGIEQPKPVSERLDDLEARLTVLETGTQANIEPGSEP